jgi:DNA-binding response OmpR family regulator
VRNIASAYRGKAGDWRMKDRSYTTRTPGVANGAAGGCTRVGSPVPAYTVLIVDDDPSIRAVLADVLAFEGYRVLTAQNGEQALRWLDQEVPHLVLLDMRMPVMNGWDFAAALRDRGVALPICVMTAARDARAWAGEINAAGFLAKPFDMTELLAAVGGLCAEHRRTA